MEKRKFGTQGLEVSYIDSANAAIKFTGGQYPEEILKRMAR